MIFDVAMTKSALLSMWIEGVGIFASASIIAAGVGLAYVEFSSSRVPPRRCLNNDFLRLASNPRFFMWRKK